MARKGENIYKRKDGRWEGRYMPCSDTIIHSIAEIFSDLCPLLTFSRHYRLEGSKEKSMIYN